jgi:hypothetical protein
MCNLKTFVALVRETFAYLETEFGATISKREKNAYAVYVTYQNSTTGVQIELSSQKEGVTVMVIRLVDGQVPAYPIFITEDTELNWFNALDFVDPPRTSLVPDVTLSDPMEPDPEELRDCLEWFADILKRHASDVLKGDFGVLESIEKRVRARAAKSYASWKNRRLGKSSRNRN